MTIYICAECKSHLDINLNDPIRCKKCGCRMMYKKRTDKPVQYVAR